MYGDDPKRLQATGIEAAVITLFGSAVTYLGLEHLPSYWGVENGVAEGAPPKNVIVTLSSSIRAELEHKR